MSKHRIDLSLLWFKFAYFFVMEETIFYYKDYSLQYSKRRKRNAIYIVQVVIMGSSVTKYFIEE